MIRGYYYYSQKCKVCGKLITGESEESRKKAKKDFYRRLTEHRQQEHKLKAKPQLRNEKTGHQATTLFPGKNHRNE